MSTRALRRDINGAPGTMGKMDLRRPNAGLTVDSHMTHILYIILLLLHLHGFTHRIGSEDF